VDLLNLLVVGLAGSLVGPRAFAVVAGTPPTRYQLFNKITGSALGIGNSLMIDSHGGCDNVNDTLLPQSEAVINVIPQGSQLLGAYLFWSGSVTAAGRTKRPTSPRPTERPFATSRPTLASAWPGSVAISTAARM